MGKKLYLIKQIIIRLFSNLFMKLKLAIFSIPYGENCVFYGQTYIFKQSSSSIILGKNLTFRSYPNSNLIGLNRNCSISTLTKEAKIEIGDNCGFSGTVIGAFIFIKIGNNVRCGANTLITDSDWHLDDLRAGDPMPIIIEDNVWIGEGVKILKGVSVGKNSVIGAGSVVTKNVPANVIAAGNPCKVLKNL